MHELELSPAFQVLVGFLIDWLTPDTWRQSLETTRERLIQQLEYSLYIARSSEQERLQQGILALVMTLLPVVAVAFLLTQAPAMGWFFSCVMLGLMLGWSRQIRYFRTFSQAMQQNDRVQTCYIVERMTASEQLSVKCDSTTPQHHLIADVIAWILLSGHNKILGVIFWFILLGAPGAILYRIITTFASHWGVEHHRYKSFGRPAAWLAKLMSFPTHHLTVLTYCLGGHFKSGYHSITQHHDHYPIKASGKALIAAGCGSLGITINLPSESSPLGQGRLAEFHDCNHARHLINVCCLGWIIVVSLGHFI